MMSFYPAKSKAIIDEIDTVLAAHYGSRRRSWISS